MRLELCHVQEFAVADHNWDQHRRQVERVRMPTLYKAQMVETQTAWWEIWNRLHKDLLPVARQILDMLGFYKERGLEIPPADAALSADEELDLTPVVSALTKAAVESQLMPPGVVVSTLSKIAKDPPELVDELPGFIQWKLARAYRRGEEKPGTYALDIWGNELTETPFIRGAPTPENIARAAQSLLEEMERSPGRPRNVANFILAENLAPIFRSSGNVAARQRRKSVSQAENLEWEIEYVEGGPYYEFLNLVVAPLNDFLRDHELPPVTVESIVRQPP
jgi:hypothetical protein